MNERRFKDKAHAGRELARKLLKFRLERPVILAIPRGGVPVASEVARELRSPLDVLPARKIGAPLHPEYGIGAIAPGEVLILESEALRRMNIRMKDLERLVENELHEMERREKMYRSGEWSRGFPTDTIVVVDDGLATGVTAKAALESVRLIYSPEHLVFAAPICAASMLTELAPHANEVICVESPSHLVSVSRWYAHFPQTSDREVMALLEETHMALERSVHTYA